MKKFLASLSVVFAACATAPAPPPAAPEVRAPETASAAVDPEAFRATPPQPAAPRPYDFPEVERLTLPNGLRILIAERPGAPLVAIRAVVRAGADRDPADHLGLATLTADLLDEGAGNRSALKIAEDLGQLGTRIQTYAGHDSSGAALDVLEKHLASALPIFADVLIRPTFAASEVERRKSDRMTSLLQRRDRAPSLATMQFNRIAARGSVYANPEEGTESTVSMIDRDDVRRFHSSVYAPNNTSLIIVGDVDAQQIRALVERHFAGWKRGKELPALRATTPIQDRSVVYLVDRPAAVQSEVRVGHVGVSRNTEDYFPLLTMNSLLGGIFTSRLNLNLREKHGYTYGVRSSFEFARDVSPFVVSTAVRNAVTSDAVHQILSELKRLRSRDLTDEELAVAKNYLMGVFPATVQTSGALAGRLVEMEIFGLPEDYFEQYRERIASVTKDDIARVADRYIAPDRATIVVVGKASEVQPALSTLNLPVELVDPATLR